MHFVKLKPQPDGKKLVIEFSTDVISLEGHGLKQIRDRVEIHFEGCIEQMDELQAQANGAAVTRMKCEPVKAEK